VVTQIELEMAERHFDATMLCDSNFVLKPLEIVALCSSDFGVPTPKLLTLSRIHLTWRSPKTVRLRMASIIIPMRFLRMDCQLFEARAAVRFSSNHPYRVTVQRPLLGKKAAAGQFEFFHYIHV
jgi:hypothetical protein